MQNYRRFLMAIIVLAAIIASCTSLPRTPESRYYAALSQFNDILEDYITYYQAAPPATQQKWKKEITPIFRHASKALDAWNLALTVTGLSSLEKERLFTKLRGRILTLMLEHGILEVK
jgi:hypothetical protein